LPCCYKDKLDEGLHAAQGSD